MVDKQNPLSINVNIDGTNLVNSTITKVASPIADSLSNLWYLTFGWLDHYSEKKRIQREANLKEYRYLVEAETAKIPSDNLIEPKISIIAPAIQSSEFYFEEEHYREMFAKLIAGSMDKSKSNLVHPSFIQIIQQFTQMDAILFKAMVEGEKIGSVPIVKATIANPENNEITREIKDILLIKGETSNITFQEISLSLNNLSRLGLIDINFLASFSDTTNYRFIDMNPLVISYKAINPQKPISFQKGIINTTTLGNAFKLVCL